MQVAEWTAKLRKQSEQLFHQGSQQAKRTFQHAGGFFARHKRKTLAIAAGLIVTAASGAYANHYHESNTYSIYHVLVNGKEIGIVNNPNVIHTWTDAKLREEKEKHGLTLTMADYITFTEEKVYKGKYDNMAAIAALSSIADIKVEAVEIVVNGELIGYAADQKSAEDVLNRIKKKFAGEEIAVPKQAVAAASISTDAPLKQVKFKEDVKLEKGTVTAAQILSPDKLEELLSKGTFKQVTHTVVEGDCIGCIAQKYGITSKDIYANNPGFTENTVLQLGQQINVTAIRPVVTVQVLEEVSRQETVAYPVETRSNEKLPKGETKVVQDGKEGSKRVTYQFVKENGQVVAKKVLDQQMISKPVAKVIERGTKVIPSRGTGSFGWPARGYISSGFGIRWGRMHKGIDIAGAGSIKAADNGRVVSAGWDGDYGKAVIIDHGNGLQTLYGHLRSINVSVGDVVPKGKVIGVMGSTGDSTGVHLHFEVHKDGRIQNPIRFLR